MKTSIDGRLEPYRKLMESAWELQDTKGNIGFTEPILDHATSALNQFEDWIVSTAPEPGKVRSHTGVADPEVLARLLE